MTNVKQLIAEAKEKGISFRNERFGRPSMPSTKPSLRLTKSYITINEPALKKLNGERIQVIYHNGYLFVEGSDNLGYKVNRNKNGTGKVQAPALISGDEGLIACGAVLGTYTGIACEDNTWVFELSQAATVEDTDTDKQTEAEAEVEVKDEVKTKRNGKTKATKVEQVVAS